jgi:hypothetical protein
LLAGGIKLLFHFICIMCTHVAHVQKSVKCKKG